MPPSPLRKLAKSYAGGNMEKEIYRKRRAAYLESVLSGEALLDDDVAESAAVRQQDDTDHEATPDTLRNAFEIRSTPPEKPAAAINSRNAAKKWIIVIGVLAVVFTFTMFLAVNRDNGGVTTTMPVESSGTPAAEMSKSVQNLILTFLEQRSWTQDAIDSFLEQWRALSEPERLAAANSVEYRQLANAIHKKLLEERALSGIGNPESSHEKQRHLVEFAAALGIRDNRFNLPE